MFGRVFLYVGLVLKQIIQTVNLFTFGINSCQKLAEVTDHGPTSWQKKRSITSTPCLQPRSADRAHRPVTYKTLSLVFNPSCCVLFHSWNFGVVRRGPRMSRSSRLFALCILKILGFLFYFDNSSK